MNRTPHTRIVARTLSVLLCALLLSTQVPVARAAGSGGTAQGARSVRGLAGAKLASRALAEDPPVLPESVALASSATGALDASYTFDAEAAPSGTTLPLTFTWEATGQDPVTHAEVQSLSDAAGFAWSTPGKQAMAVTVASGRATRPGRVCGTRSLCIECLDGASHWPAPLSERVRSAGGGAT